MTTLKSLKGLLAGAALVLSLPMAAHSAEYSFNLQSFLPIMTLKISRLGMMALMAFPAISSFAVTRRP